MILPLPSTTYNSIFLITDISFWDPLLKAFFVYIVYIIINIMLDSFPFSYGTALQACAITMLSLTMDCIYHGGPIRWQSCWKILIAQCHCSHGNTVAHFCVLVVMPGSADLLHRQLCKSTDVWLGTAVTHDNGSTWLWFWPVHLPHRTSYHQFSAHSLHLQKQGLPQVCCGVRHQAAPHASRLPHLLMASFSLLLGLVPCRFLEPHAVQVSSPGATGLPQEPGVSAAPSALCECTLRRSHGDGTASDTLSERMALFSRVWLREHKLFRDRVA